ncbi:MAG: hypothetical protein Kow006_33700 [Gammaproteobacteria bacterium]
MLLGVALMTLSGVALAGHCPKDAKAIDHALQSSKLSAADKQAVKAMRDEGMKLHQAGDHRNSERILAEAMRKLLMAN